MQKTTSELKIIAKNEKKIILSNAIVQTSR